MVRSSRPGLIPRILLCIAGGGVYYLIARYAALEPDAGHHATLMAVALSAYGILQYAFLKFDQIAPRLVISIVTGGLCYLVARYVFSYPSAGRLGIVIFLAIDSVIILEALFRGVIDTLTAMLLCILGGVVVALSAHYVFSYPYAVNLAILSGGISALLIDTSPTEGRRAE